MSTRHALRFLLAVLLAGPLSAQPDRPEENPLLRAMEARFGAKPERAGNEVRFSRERGREVVAQVMEAFPGLVESVTVAKPSLEDVFLARTREVWS